MEKLSPSELNVVEGKNWRFVTSSDAFDRSWFPRHRAIDVVYHFDPSAEVLTIHFANFVSVGTLVAGGLAELAKKYYGTAAEMSIRLPCWPSREDALEFAELLQGSFERRRSHVAAALKQQR